MQTTATYPSEAPVPKLTTALIKARRKFGAVSKSKTANAEKYSYRYADLAAAIEATDPALADNGLVVMQTTRLGDEGKGIVLVTELLHESGEAKRGEYPILPTRPDPQGYGSALTYARRYTYLAILGIATEDDDGQAASQPAPAARSAPRTATPPAKPTSAAPGPGKAPPLPKTGEELCGRILGIEKNCVALGFCQEGELVRDLLEYGKSKQFPERIEDYPPKSWGNVLKWCQAWKDARQKAPKKAS